MRKLLHIFRSILQRLCAASNAFRQAFLGRKYLSKPSYSQYGEDMVLKAIFARYPITYPGFYVDIGAHHPLRFSNTRFFYEQGWSGICVDPLPGSAQIFTRWRPRDMFLQVGVANAEGEMTYFMFDEPALNTFSEKIAGENVSRVRLKQKVKVFPLRRIFADHLPAREVDFLSVDVEGLDMEVLHSNDWTVYRPRIVLIEETIASTLDDVENLEVAIFMKQHAYRAFARTPSALFFVDTRSTVYDGSSYLRFSNITFAKGGPENIT
ncbi:MAG: FkbM family methyltransferase [Candidatus Sabulitectum sp.]|nr:FkbM family methyltransferase [Candidatus Sabulitectum sp.]